MAFYIIISSLLAGMLCSMGFGGGTVLIVFLVNVLNYNQTAAQGINLMFFVFCAIYALIKHIRNGLVDKQKVMIMSIGGVIGVCLGYILLKFIPTGYLSKLFGVFITALGIIQIIKSMKNRQRK